jgi:hypothetical protein
MVNPSDYKYIYLILHFFYTKRQPVFATRTGGGGGGSRRPVGVTPAPSPHPPAQQFNDDTYVTLLLSYILHCLISSLS